ncbi:hypothetical protein V1477_018829, partial [Vespula maculifrons]
TTHSVTYWCIHPWKRFVIVSRKEFDYFIIQQILDRPSVLRNPDEKDRASGFLSADLYEYVIHKCKPHVSTWPDTCRCGIHTVAIYGRGKASGHSNALALPSSLSRSRRLCERSFGNSILGKISKGSLARRVARRRVRRDQIESSSLPTRSARPPELAIQLSSYPVQLSSYPLAN